MSDDFPQALVSGRQYTTWVPAGTYEVPGKGEFRERFAPGAFDRVIGQVVPIKYEGAVIGRGRVISAQVAEDGSGVSLTYDVLGEEPQP